MKVQVKITRGDIKRGKQHVGSECAAIWALERVFGPDVIDRVTRAYIVFRDGRRKKSPAILRDFCQTFDRFGPSVAKPIQFSVNL